MKYKFTIERGYYGFEFIFDKFSEGCVFMKEALDSSQEEISFKVERITEDEEESTDEAITEEEESTDEE